MWPNAFNLNWYCQNQHKKKLNRTHTGWGRPGTQCRYVCTDASPNNNNNNKYTKQRQPSATIAIIPKPNRKSKNRTRTHAHNGAEVKMVIYAHKKYRRTYECLEWKVNGCSIEIGPPVLRKKKKYERKKRNQRKQTVVRGACDGNRAIWYWWYVILPFSPLQRT